MSDEKNNSEASMNLNTMRDYSEKRDFIRMKIDAEIILVDKDGKKRAGRCKDLSGTGMSMELDEPVTVGEEMHTSLPSNNPAFPSFDTAVNILRCDALDSGKYLVGVEIVNVK